MPKKFLTLLDIRAYKVSSDLSDFVWDTVSKWDWFSKRTIGGQLINAIDSIAGNVAEGFGRFHKKDKQKFFYNARGSLYESIHWAEKGKVRNLLTSDQYERIITELSSLPKEINWLIKITEEKLRL